MPKKEISIAYTIVILTTFASNFILATTVIYLLQKNITLTQINFIDAIILWLVMLLEIPTGLLADRYSQRKSFMASLLSKSIFLLLLTFAHGFVNILLVFLFSALADSLWSGSFISWFLEKNKKQNPEQESIKVFANLNIITSAVAIAAGIIGSLVSTIKLDYAYYISTFLFCVSFTLCFLLSDETKVSNEEQSEHSVKNILKAGFTFFKSLPLSLLCILLISLLGYIPISGIDNFWQPKIQAANSTSGFFLLGIAWAIIRAATLLASVFVKLLSRQQFAIAMTVCLFASAIFLLLFANYNNAIILIFAFALHAMMWVAFSTIASAVTFDYFPARSRATIFSLLSVLGSLCGSAGLLLFGYLAHFGLQVTFIIATIMMVIFAIFTLLNKKGLQDAQRF